LYARSVRAGSWERVILNFLWAIPFLLVFAFGLAMLAMPLDAHDEPASLVWASLVRHGQVPGVDFSAIYPPLTLYLDAASFAVFGETLVATRSLRIGFYLLVLVVATRLFKNCFGRDGLAVPAALLILAGTFAMPLKLNVANTLALTLITLLVVWEAGIGKRFVIGIGVLTGLVCACRLNFGLYLAIAIAGSMVLEELSACLERRSFRPLLHLVRPLAIFLGTVLVVALGLIAALSRGAVAEVFEQTLIEPQRFVPVYRFLDIARTPVNASIVLLCPLWFLLRALVERRPSLIKILSPILAGVVLVGLLFANGQNPAIARYVPITEMFVVAVLHLFVLRLTRVELCFLLFWAAELHYPLSTMEPYHMTPSVPLLGLMAILFVFTADKRWVYTGQGMPEIVSSSDSPPPSEMRFDEGRKADWHAKGDLRITALQAAGVLVILAGVLFVHATRKDWTLNYSPRGTWHGLNLIFSSELTARISDAERLWSDRGLSRVWRSILMSGTQEGELDAIKFVRSQTSPEDPVFAGSTDHSTLFGNRVRIYWYLQRKVGVRDFLFVSGITTAQSTQMDMIADLKRNNVQWVILEKKPLKRGPLAALKRLEGSHLLDDFIRQSFRPVADFTNYLVLTSR
jgi:hypothetical protein